MGTVRGVPRSSALEEHGRTTDGVGERFRAAVQVRVLHPQRPDALALAVRTGAPIFAAEDVISESAIEFEHEVEDTEEVVEKFKDFLDNVTPEDFAAGEEEDQ